MREVPWSAVRQLTDCRLGIPCAKAVATATALQGAFGREIFSSRAGSRSAKTIFPLDNLEERRILISTV